MQKYSTTIWKRVGRGGLAFIFPPFLLLAAGIGIDKVPRNQANVTHQPPPLSKAGNAQTFPVHYYMEKNPSEYCMNHTGALENAADTLFSNWNGFQMMQHLNPRCFNNLPGKGH